MAIQDMKTVVSRTKTRDKITTMYNTQNDM